MDRNIKGISRRCAEFITDVSFSDFDSSTISTAKKCIIDWLGCVIGGSSMPAARLIAAVVDEMGGKPQATCIGDFKKATVLQSAMVNAYNCHILEMDDVHKSSIVHPAAPVISTALSLAEYLGSSGKELLEAIVVGYDLMIRIGEAVAPSHYKIWHSTATCGTFGAAAASAKLLNLEPEQVLNSLGNAGSQAAGLWEFASDKAMTKYLHCGKAAYNGLLSSLMAQKGFTGATRILEGERGFFKAYSREKDFEHSFKDLGKTYRINETVYKPYASCRHTHGPITGVLEIMKANSLSYTDVENVDVKTYTTALDIAGNKDFETPQAARFNMNYCIACALVYGAVGIDQFQDSCLKDIAVTTVLPRIHVSASRKMDELYPRKWASEVCLKTRKGNLFKIFVEYPKGDPENTMNQKEIEGKYLQLAGLKLATPAAMELLERCYTIENYPDLTIFFNLKNLNRVASKRNIK